MEAMNEEKLKNLHLNSDESVEKDAKNDAGFPDHRPISILVIGMAGSGKTTLLQRLNAHIHEKNIPGYIINLDPAVMNLPYGPNIDIRDTVNYKNVMKQYNLGPNGAILTSLNLFATRFDQVIALCEKPREPKLKYVFVDTPGQIEIFTWSASGSIITEAFANTFPTMIAYVIDTPRCVSPQTFMTNMLQACSILYKTRLPMLLVFNKIDVVHHEYALEWMHSYDAFSAALDADATYAASLSRSLSLVLEEFYENLDTVGISAATGEGIDDFFKAVGKCAQDYKDDYLPDLERRIAQKEKENEERKREEKKKLMEDIKRSETSEQQEAELDKTQK